MIEVPFRVGEVDRSHIVPILRGIRAVEQPIHVQRNGIGVFGVLILERRHRAVRKRQQQPVFHVVGVAVFTGQVGHFVQHLANGIVQQRRRIGRGDGEHHVVRAPLALQRALLLRGRQRGQGGRLLIVQARIAAAVHPGDEAVVGRHQLLPFRDLAADRRGEQTIQQRRGHVAAGKAFLGLFRRAVDDLFQRGHALAGRLAVLQIEGHGQVVLGGVGQRLGEPGRLILRLRVRAQGLHTRVKAAQGEAEAIAVQRHLFRPALPHGLLPGVFRLVALLHQDAAQHLFGVHEGDLAVGGGVAALLLHQRAQLGHGGFKPLHLVGLGDVRRGNAVVPGIDGIAQALRGLELRQLLHVGRVLHCEGHMQVVPLDFLLPVPAVERIRHAEHPERGRQVRVAGEDRRVLLHEERQAVHVIVQRVHEIIIVVAVPGLFGVALRALLDDHAGIAGPGARGAELGERAAQVCGEILLRPIRRAEAILGLAVFERLAHFVGRVVTVVGRPVAVPILGSGGEGDIQRPVRFLFAQDLHQLAIGAVFIGGDVFAHGLKLLQEIPRVRRGVHFLQHLLGGHAVRQRLFAAGQQAVHRFADVVIRHVLFRGLLLADRGAYAAQRQYQRQYRQNDPFHR